MADSPKAAEAAQALFCAMADYIGSSAIDKKFSLKTYPTYAAFKYAQPFYDKGFQWQLAAIWIAGPVIGLFVLIYTRILIELNIAVVNIAENTESS